MENETRGWGSSSSHLRAYNPCPARGMSVLSATVENNNHFNCSFLPGVPELYEERADVYRLENLEGVAASFTSVGGCQEPKILVERPLSLASFPLDIAITVGARPHRN